MNILGYREPNLVTLWQCRGFCGNSGSQISCLPLKITQKSVNMMFQSNSSGRDPTEGSQELILDEHAECGCRCNPWAALQCTGRFNDDTCQCECDLRRFGEEKLICESLTGTVWGERTENTP